MTIGYLPISDKRNEFDEFIMEFLQYFNTKVNDLT